MFTLVSVGAGFFLVNFRCKSYKRDAFLIIEENRSRCGTGKWNEIALSLEALSVRIRTIRWSELKKYKNSELNKSSVQEIFFHYSNNLNKKIYYSTMIQMITIITNVIILIWGSKRNIYSQIEFLFPQSQFAVLPLSTHQRQESSFASSLASWRKSIPCSLITVYPVITIRFRRS